MLIIRAWHNLGKSRCERLKHLDDKVKNRKYFAKYMKNVDCFSSIAKNKLSDAYRRKQSTTKPWVVLQVVSKIIVAVKFCGKFEQFCTVVMFRTLGVRNLTVVESLCISSCIKICVLRLAGNFTSLSKLILWSQLSIILLK